MSIFKDLPYPTAPSPAHLGALRAEYQQDAAPVGAAPAREPAIHSALAEVVNNAEAITHRLVQLRERMQAVLRNEPIAANREEKEKRSESSVPLVEGLLRARDHQMDSARVLNDIFERFEA